MINRIIEFSIKNKLVIGILTLALIAWGIFSMIKLPVDAVPDITNNQVQIISIAPTLATQEVEKFITEPIEIAVSNIPDVIELRSISRLGLSVVTVVFKDEVNTYHARQLINERLQEVENTLHDGTIKPELAPVSTGLGEIYQYALMTKKGYEHKYSAMDLRTIQDWIVKRQMAGTPGVAEVNSYGGFVKEYEVAVNPDQLKNMNVSILEIMQALEKNNENTGGAYIEKNSNSYFIRGIGLVNNLEDIKKIVIKITPDGTPILVSDVAIVQIGNANRYGAFVVDTIGEAVGGVVMMLKGSNASQVIKDVKEKMKTIEKSLPEGVYIQPFLDRTELVDRAIGTVTDNLLIGALIVIFVLVLFLGNLRAGLVVASVIPLSMLFAISMMNLFGVSGNLMSLGAVDFGLIIDGAVIIVESVVHHIYLSKHKIEGVSRISQEEMDSKVSVSAKRMMSSATFGQIIILIVYIPILALVGIEGKMFRPMAETVSFAIIGALILSITYVPFAASLFLNKNILHKKNFSDKLMNGMHKFFNPVINYALYHKKVVIISSIVIFGLSIFVFGKLGGEFMTELDEGDLAASVITLQGGSLSNTVETVEKANKILMKNFPEIKHAICKIGAAEIPTDPTPMETGDYVIVMKPKSEWTTADNREELTILMKEKLKSIAGVEFGFQQPIQMRFNELMTGSKQDVAIKIFGDNLDSLAYYSEIVERYIKSIEGVQDIQVEQVAGSPQIQVTYNRDKIAQYGLNICDINKVLSTAFAGSSVGFVYEEEKRFDLVVRLQNQFRQSIDHVKSLYVTLDNGIQIPLTELASVEIKNGTAQVSRENTKRRITISFNVRNRDVRSIVKDVQTLLDTKINLPPGYYSSIGGEFENMTAAVNRLAVAVPVSLLLIFIILFFTFNSLKKSLLIFSAVPLATIGGIAALWIRDMNFSISAGIGFIALFGVAVLNGIVLIAEFNRLETEAKITDIYNRVVEGLKTRLRPVIMTAAVASLGFLPMALSNSAGAEVQKPLATVVIGGLITSTLLTLIVLPVLYILFMKKSDPNKKNNALNTTLSIGIFGAVLMLFSNQSYAQTQNPKVYTLQEAIEQSLGNNGNIKTSLYEVEMQKKLKSTAWDFGQTTLDYSYGQTNSFANDESYTVTQSFLFPTAYITYNKLAVANILNAEIRLKATQNEIVYRVKSIYYLTSYYYSKLNFLYRQDSIFRSYANAANLKYEKGENTFLEKINAETKCYEIKNKINTTQSDIELQLKKLQSLLNESQPITIFDTVLQKHELKLNRDSMVLSDNPTLACLENQMRLTDLSVKVERSKLWPEFEIGYVNQSNKELADNARFTGIQAGLSIPLLFFSQKGKIRASQINSQMAKNNYDVAQNEIKNEFDALYTVVVNTGKSLDYYRSFILPNVEIGIKQATLSYHAGEIGYIEYLQFLNQSVEIKNTYLETLNSYNQTCIEIEKIINQFN
jgi:cobalt-zinc-cadmium resistance protein CzcA